MILSISTKLPGQPGVERADGIWVITHLMDEVDPGARRSESRTGKGVQMRLVSPPVVPLQPVLREGFHICSGRSVTPRFGVYLVGPDRLLQPLLKVAKRNWVCFEPEAFDGYVGHCIPSCDFRRGFYDCEVIVNNMRQIVGTDPPPRAGSVYRAKADLEGMVLSGELQPGERLNERSLTSRFG